MKTPIVFTVEGTSVSRKNRVFGAHLERGWEVGDGGLFGICLCDKILSAVVGVVVIVDRVYITLFSALEETHCARIRFCLRP